MINSANMTTSTPERNVLHRRIGSTLYRVGIEFNPNARESLDEKILRPSAYIALRDGYDMPEPDDKHNWNGATVSGLAIKSRQLRAMNCVGSSTKSCSLGAVSASSSRR